jgi:hypothetical protein
MITVFGLMVRSTCDNGRRSAVAERQAKLADRAALEQQLAELEARQRVSAEQKLASDVARQGASADPAVRANEYGMRILQETERDPLITRLRWGQQKLDDRIARMDAVSRASDAQVMVLEPERAASYLYPAQQLGAIGALVVVGGLGAGVGFATGAAAGAVIGGAAGWTVAIGAALLMQKYRLQQPLMNRVMASSVRDDLRQDVARLRPGVDANRERLSQEEKSTPARLQDVVLRVPTQSAQPAPAPSVEVGDTLILNGVHIQRRPQT